MVKINSTWTDTAELFDEGDVNIFGSDAQTLVAEDEETPLLVKMDGFYRGNDPKFTVLGKDFEELIDDSEMEMGDYHIKSPSNKGLLVRIPVDGTNEYDYKIYSPLDIEIQQLYQETIYDSYDSLNIPDQHPDIANRTAPDGVEVPEGMDEGLFSFAVAASLGTIDERRGQEDGKESPKLETIISVDDNGRIKGFVLFGQHELTERQLEAMEEGNHLEAGYYIAQMGVRSDLLGQGVGSHLMTEVLHSVHDNNPANKVAITLGTRHGNIPAEKIYADKLGMKQSYGEVVDLPDEKYNSFVRSFTPRELEHTITQMQGSGRSGSKHTKPIFLGTEEDLEQINLGTAEEQGTSFVDMVNNQGKGGKGNGR